MKSKTATVVSVDGECIAEMFEGDRIVRKKSIDYLNMTQEWNMESFIKGHIGEMRKIMGELDTHEKAFMFSIMTYIGYEDCCLKYDNGNELAFDEIVAISGLSRGKASEVINSLIKKDVLYKGKNSSKNRQYFVNPWLFCKGNRINKVLATMFSNYRIRILDNKQWKTIRLK